MDMKPLEFAGSSLEALRDFPEEARRVAGFELYALQCGLDPSDWRPMPAVGGGARELRIHVLGEWRVIYIARLRHALVVLHAFKKKTRKTSRLDIELACRRLKQIGGKP